MRMWIGTSRAPMAPDGRVLSAQVEPSSQSGTVGYARAAEAVRRAGIDPGAVDDCVLGNVISAGLGQNPARQAALRAGLPERVSAVTI